MPDVTCLVLHEVCSCFLRSFFVFFVATVIFFRRVTDPHVRRGCADVLIKVSCVLVYPLCVSVVLGAGRFMFFDQDSPGFTVFVSTVGVSFVFVA